MKKITFLFAVIIFSVHAFSQNWQWARGSTGGGNQEGYDVAADDFGNVFVTGYYGNAPTITFGTTTLTNAGTFDIFLAKYDGAGNLVWAKSAGGPDGEVGYSVATDASGSVFLTGFFKSPTITFGSIILTNTNPLGGEDVYLVKYDAVGNVLWAKSAGGTGWELAYGATTDAAGNVFITGNFGSSTITFGTTTLTNTGGDDFFLVKYDASGNVIWAKSAGGTGGDYGYNVATDASGNIFATGNFTSPTLTFGTTTLTNAGGPDMFLVKYDSSGAVLWATSAGGTADEYCYGIAADASGSVYITGDFYSPSITFGTNTFTNAGMFDFFLAKYDGMGNLVWAKGAGGANADFGFGVATDMSQNVYVSGGFMSSSIVFNSDTLLFPLWGWDAMFLVKYDPSGNVLSTSVLTSGGDDQNAVATNALGNVFIGGDYYMVDPFVVGPDTLHVTANENAFVAKCSCQFIENVNAFSNEKTLTVSPNPASNELRIENSELKIEIVEIYDALGQRAFSQQPAANSRQLYIDVSSLGSGIYFVKVKTEKGIRMAKFMKQ